MHHISVLADQICADGKFVIDIRENDFPALTLVFGNEVLDSSIIRRDIGIILSVWTPRADGGKNDDSTGGGLVNVLQ